MKLKTQLFGKTYEFKSVKEVLAKANEEKSGDKLAGIAAVDASERVAAKVVLADLTVGDLRNHPVVPYESDEVTRVIQDGVNEEQYKKIESMSMGDFREFLLDSDAKEIEGVRDGLTAEVIAGAAKLMSNMDLVVASKKLIVPATCNTTIGLPGTLAARLQPNHPTDSVEGVMASVYEGIAYANGDALIGLNPAIDTVENTDRILKTFREFMDKWEIPSQNCVLSHVTTQMEALKQGSPMDLMFQSIAGSEISNSSFGISTALIDEAYELMKEKKSSAGPNFMYFETGQGSELSSDGHNDADQLVMEARCYGFAKRYHPYCVNTVVGFIGPEYLYDGAQVIRAGLEDHFMGKLTGIPMGCDVCYTNHMKASQNDLENLAMIIAEAGVNYVMGVPAGDDIMLMYQSSGYHDVAAMREVTGKRPMAEFEKRMEELGIMENGKLTKLAGDPSIFA
ncbi:MAG: ethanolamine ammonia-lyase subunit EutB [Lachnospiraceae bacterium]|nr:ethanolamine ammonia-lyase subunit EutB [Lachnospiraceae bacterium]MDD3617501.1 ethanolamine ammonia-lyase subunit EutB [Lachnospiraceae bacterium]